MKRLILFTPFIIASAGIFYLSHQPMDDYLQIDFILSDKILHLIGYFGYGLTLLSAALAFWNIDDRRKIFLTILLFGALFALSDEIHQYFIPGRNCDFFDWVADMIGITLSLFMLKPVAGVFKMINIIGH
jgi:VanZ family protein